MEPTSGNEQVKMNQPDMHDTASRAPSELFWCLWIYAGWIWCLSTFFSIKPSYVCKDHLPWMSLHLQVSQPERVYLSLKSSSDISRASGFLREWPSSLRPLRRLSLGIKYILSTLTAPWTTFGISLFKQILCKVSWMSAQLYSEPSSVRPL